MISVGMSLSYSPLQLMMTSCLVGASAAPFVVNSAVGVALYVAGGFWVVPDHGAVGMAAVDAVVTAVINSARVVEAKLLVGVQPFGKSFAKPVIATAVGTATVLLWKLVPGDNAVLDIAATRSLSDLRRVLVHAASHQVVRQVRLQFATAQRCADLPRLRVRHRLSFRLSRVDPDRADRRRAHSSNPGQ